MHHLAGKLLVAAVLVCAAMIAGECSQRDEDSFGGWLEYLTDSAFHFSFETRFALLRMRGESSARLSLTAPLPARA